MNNDAEKCLHDIKKEMHFMRHFLVERGVCWSVNLNDYEGCTIVAL